MLTTSAEPGPALTLIRGADRGPPSHRSPGQDHEAGIGRQPGTPSAVRRRSRAETGPQRSHAAGKPLEMRKQCLEAWLSAARQQDHGVPQFRWTGRRSSFAGNRLCSQDAPLRRRASLRPSTGQGDEGRSRGNPAAEARTLTVLHPRDDHAAGADPARRSGRQRPVRRRRPLHHRPRPTSRAVTVGEVVGHDAHARRPRGGRPPAPQPMPRTDSAVVRRRARDAGMVIFLFRVADTSHPAPLP